MSAFRGRGPVRGLRQAMGHFRRDASRVERKLLRRLQRPRVAPAETGERPPPRIAPAEVGALIENLEIWIKRRLWAQILAGMALGIGTGLLLSPDGAGLVGATTAQELGEWLALPGQLFLALIQMMMIPLVMASIVVGVVSSGDLEHVKRLSVRILPYFVATTVVAVTIGASLAFLVKPGHLIDSEFVQGAAATTPVPDAQADDGTEEPGSLPDRIVSVIPSNPLGAALDRSMLQVVVFAILVAVAIVAVGATRTAPLVEFAGATQEVALKVVSWAMLLAPIAVFGLLAQVMIDIGLDAIVGTAAYVGTVLGGLLLLLVFYLLVVSLGGRTSPWRFLSSARDAQLLAFSTSSSAAVMPLSIRTAEEELGVRPSVSRFVIPLGATVNMDGTALYQVTAAVFLTQVFDIDLSLSALILLMVTTVGASIGAPSAPGVGIVILATIVQTVGVPPSGVALIIGVDRILDMARTTLNVTGDLAACTVFEEREEALASTGTAPADALPAPAAPA